MSSAPAAATNKLKRLCTNIGLINAKANVQVNSSGNDHPCERVAGRSGRLERRMQNKICLEVLATYMRVLIFVRKTVKDIKQETVSSQTLDNMLDSMRGHTRQYSILLYEHITFYSIALYSTVLYSINGFHFVLF